MNKIAYETAETEIIYFEAEDIIATSDWELPGDEEEDFWAD